MTATLTLTLDETWAAGTTAVLAWGALVAYPDDVEPWKQRSLELDLGDATLVIRGTERLKTKTGWPFELVTASVVRAGQPVEERVAAFYKFLEYGAVVLLRAPDLAAIDRVRPGVLAALATAAPRWSPVCLHELLA